MVACGGQGSPEKRNQPEVCIHISAPEGDTAQHLGSCLVITKAEESHGPPAVSKPEARTAQSESRAQSLRGCWGKALSESENRDPRHRGPRAGEGRRPGVSRERDFVLSLPFRSLQALPGRTSSVHSQADGNHAEQIPGRPVASQGDARGSPITPHLGAGERATALDQAWPLPVRRPSAARAPTPRPGSLLRDSCDRYGPGLCPEGGGRP